MDYADLRQAIHNRLVAEVGAVGGRVFGGWIAPADTDKPYICFNFMGELPAAVNVCGMFQQVEVICYGDENGYFALDAVADAVMTALHKVEFVTPDGRTIWLEHTRDARLDGWSETHKASLIRLKFILPTDVWS